LASPRDCCFGTLRVTLGSTPSVDDVVDARLLHNVELVFTPTYASFLNRIECHFWAIGEFVVNNADYPN
jgi:hypothetical protein